MREREQVGPMGGGRTVGGGGRETIRRVLSEVTYQVIVEYKLALFTAVDLAVASGCGEGGGRGTSPGEGSRSKIRLSLVLSTMLLEW